MKKIILTSLAAVFAVSAANAANVFDDNPMYRPSEGRFYSETALSTDTDLDTYTLGEGFGFGITDKLSVFMNTSLSYDDPSEIFAWDFFQLGASYRYFDQDNIKADVYGKGMQIYNTGDNFDTLETLAYNWTVGTKVGYVAEDWTVAAKAEMNYSSDDVDYLDAEGWWMTAGLMGQYVIDSNWNLVAGLDYTFNVSGDDYVTEDGLLIAKIGGNYNFDETKFVGVYVTKEAMTNFDENPLGFGAKFGIDF